MATYTIIVKGEEVAYGVTATSANGAVDRYFDMKKGKIPKEVIKAVVER